MHHHFAFSNQCNECCLYSHAVLLNIETTSTCDYNIITRGPKGPHCKLKGSDSFSEKEIGTLACEDAEYHVLPLLMAS